MGRVWSDVLGSAMKASRGNNKLKRKQQQKHRKKRKNLRKRKIGRRDNPTTCESRATFGFSEFSLVTEDRFFDLCL